MNPSEDEFIRFLHVGERILQAMKLRIPNALSRVWDRTGRPSGWHESFFIEDGVRFSYNTQHIVEAREEVDGKCICLIMLDRLAESYVDDALYEQRANPALARVLVLEDLAEIE